MSRTPAHHGHPATELPGSERRSWALLAVALAAQVLVVLDISVVNTALPTIGRSLQLSGDDLQWLVTAYVMMSGGGLLLGGRVSDLLSRRRVFLTGLALFTLASVASGMAESGTQLVAARAAQGLSAALLTPSALSLITTTYSGHQQKAALRFGGPSGAGESRQESSLVAPSPRGPAGSSSSGSTLRSGSSPSSSAGASSRRSPPPAPRSRTSTSLGQSP